MAQLYAKGGIGSNPIWAQFMPRKLRFCPISCGRGFEATEFLEGEQHSDIAEGIWLHALKIQKFSNTTVI